MLARAVRSRRNRAAPIACDAAIAESLSGRTVRTSRGRSSSEPAWMVVRPESAWITGSYAGLCAHGPVSPKPESDR